MKVIWEASDIVCGQRVGSPKRSEQWIIGYWNGEAKDNNFVLVSLEDGMVGFSGSAEGLAAHLNKTEDAPVELVERKRRPAIRA